MANGNREQVQVGVAGLRSREKTEDETERNKLSKENTDD